MALTRRQFLRGSASARAPALRPPWAGDETEFVDRCTRCGACAAACPTGVIAAGAGGFPCIDFSRGECTFCGECLAACRDGALAPGRVPWHCRAAIGDACLARANVVCRTCGDACEPRALRFRPRLGAAARPEIDIDACTGCGACVAVCPAGAVTVAAFLEEIPA